MSQQTLASKTITKRNVAQSSVIFSVVVAVITLGVIATVAYVDIKEEIESVSAEKSIPEMIAEQKIKSEENRKQAVLASQAEDLVLTMDQRVEDLKQLEQKVKKVNEQLNFIHTNLQSKSVAKKLVTAPVSPQSVLKTIKTVQRSPQHTNLNSNDAFHYYVNSIFNQNHAFNLSNKQQATAAGEVFFELSWLFRARGSMGMDQQFLLSGQSNAQNQWNAQSF